MVKRFIILYILSLYFRNSIIFMCKNTIDAITLLKPLPFFYTKFNLYVMNNWIAKVVYILVTGVCVCVYVNMVCVFTCIQILHINLSLQVLSLLMVLSLIPWLRQRAPEFSIVDVHYNKYVNCGLYFEAMWISKLFLSLSVDKMGPCCSPLWSVFY